MKKYVLFAAFLMVTAINAQEVHKNQQNGTDLSELVNRGDYYGLSLEQKNKLIARKKTIGREYAAIGRDRSLSGYEKGVKKRELSQQIQADIRAILNEDQYSKWSKYNENQYKGKAYAYKNKGSKEDIERRIDLLESEYEQDIKKIEREYRNDKYALKREKNNRKALYKKERQKLKDQR